MLRGLLCVFMILCAASTQALAQPKNRCDAIEIGVVNNFGLMLRDAAKTGDGSDR